MSPDSAETRKARSLDFKVLRLVRFTVPLHALLPFVIWQIGRVSQPGAIWFVLALHAFFLIVILAGFPWWRGQGPQLALVIILDHLTTFVVGGLLANAIG